VRQSLVDHGLRLVAGGYVVGADGNLSVRDGEGLLITPSRVAYDRLQPGQVVRLDLAGAGDPSRSSEWAVHCAVYRSRPEVRAVIHAHPVFACVLAVRGEVLEALLDEVGPVLGGPVAVADYAPSGILANHGTVTVGVDLEEAFYRLQVLERAAQVQVLR